MLSRALLVAASRRSRHAQQRVLFSSAHAQATAESSSEPCDDSFHPESDKDDIERTNKQQGEQREERQPSSSLSPSLSSSSQQQQQPLIDFGDTRASFSSVPTAKLLRSAATLGACAYSPPWLVERAAAAYHGSLASTSSSSSSSPSSSNPQSSPPGLFPSLVGAFLSRALYPHFCAGATAEEASKVADELAARGVGSILNYAAEEAVNDEGEDEGGGGRGNGGGGIREGSAGERRRDAAAELFLASVAGARPSPRPGRPSWVAIKMSALAPPSVLERASAAIVAASEEAARRAGNDAPLHDRGLWACDDALSAALGRQAGHPSSSSAAAPLPLDGDGVAALLRGEQRLRRVALAASRRGNTRVIVDAEQTWLQPIIDVLAVRAMREFNRFGNNGKNGDDGDDPTVVQTYQCYLRSTPRRVAADAARASSEGFVLGAKPVRGAYLAAERALAASRGVPDPVHATIEDTHRCYDGVVGRLLDGVRDRKAHLLVASHNRESVERAVEGMRSRGMLRPSSESSSPPPRPPPVAFGQLLGMADSLTLGLAARGLDALKILAYGDLGVVCSFLVRRAQENANALGGARAESGAQAREVARRMLSFPFSPSPRKRE